MTTSPTIGAHTPERPIAPAEERDPREGRITVFIREAVARLDLAASIERYHEDDGLLVLPGFLPAAMAEEMADEARRLAPTARRTHVPFVRKGGAISHPAIVARAPALHALHQSPAMLGLGERLTGHTLEHRKPDDPHASALYVYDRRGDHVGWHRDDCGCEPEASFTAILGLVNRTNSRLEFELFRDRPGRRPVLRSVATEPGTLVFFCGSTAHHRLAPLAAGEERMSFSFVYVKQGFHPEGYNRLRQTAINAFLYFGVEQLFKR